MSHFQRLKNIFIFLSMKTDPTFVYFLPSSISGGNPPTNTFLENLSIPKSKSDLGDPFKEEPIEGTI